MYLYTSVKDSVSDKDFRPITEMSLLSVFQKFSPDWGPLDPETNNGYSPIAVGSARSLRVLYGPTVLVT